MRTSDDGRRSTTRWSATPRPACRLCSRWSTPSPTPGHLEKCRSSYHRWQRRQLELADPAYESKPKGLLRRKVDNPEHRIRPELVAATVDRLPPPDAIFTTDTGMATVWLSRFVRMTGQRG